MSDSGGRPGSGSRGAVSSGGLSRQAIRVAQAAADAKLHQKFEASGDGNAFDYSQSVDASRGITLPKTQTSDDDENDAAASRSGGSVLAYLQRMQRGGNIQSFGCLLLVENGTFNVLAFSENAREMLGLVVPPEALQEAPAPQVEAASGGESSDDAAASACLTPPPGQRTATNTVGSALRSLSRKIRRAMIANSQKRGDRVAVPEHSALSDDGSDSTLTSAGSRGLSNGSRSSRGSTSSGSSGLERIGTLWRAFSRRKKAPRDAPKELPSPPPKAPPPPPPPLEFGVSALSLFSAESISAIHKATAANDISVMNPILVQSKGYAHDRPFYAILHRVQEGLVVDLEPIRPQDMVFTGEGALQAHRLAAKAIARLERVPVGDLKLLCETVANEVRVLTGYDRVMVYKFHEDEHGEVLAEARKDSMEPYLGLHYPATDIPQAARFMFMKSRVRTIADAEAPTVNILQDPLKLQQPVVLLGSTLRAAHGCHIQYMKNMGTLASVTLAVVTRDAAAGAEGKSVEKLWGLCVCHNETPRYLPYPMRLACEFLIQVFSLKVNKEQEMATQAKEKDMLKVQTLLCDMLLRDAGPVGLVTQYPNIMDLVRCDGAALLFGGRCWLLGVTPTESQLAEIVDWLRSEHGGSSGFSTDSMKDAGYPLADSLGDEVCGMIAAQLVGGDYVFWFRSHVEKEVEWAGAKHDPGERDDARKMHPRSSFAAFLEVVRQRSPPWDDVEIDAVSSLLLILRGRLTTFSQTDINAMTLARLGNKFDEERVSVAESELSRILETATAPVFTVDRSGCVSAWNDKMAALTGLSAGEAMGRSLVHELCADKSKNIVGWTLSQAMLGKDADRLEMIIKTFSAGGGAQRRMSGNSIPDGGEVVLQVNAFVSRGGLQGLDEGEEGEEGEGPRPQAAAPGEPPVSGVCFVGQDLTQQKEVEGHFTKIQGDYAAIVHSGNSLIPPIFAIDATGVCAEWNPAMEKLAGLSRGEAVGELLLGSLFGGALRMKGDARTKLMIVLNRAVTGQNTEHYPLAFLNRQGHLVESLLTVQARRDAAGEVMGAFCFLHTASAELQSALKLQRAAEEFAESQAKTVAYMRQEMRGPLDGVKYVRSHMEGWEGLGAQARRVLETSVRCEQQVARVLGDDNVENLEEGFLGLESDEYRLADVIETVMAIAKQAAAHSGLSIGCECAEDLNTKPPLAGDAVRLQQALSEFVSTAVQFTPRGGKVLVKVITGGRACFDKSTLRCEFRALHSGPQGVPPAMIKQMYDRCEDKGEMTQEGLGLSIARKIVQAMGGDVQYDRNFTECEFVARLSLAYPQDSSSSATPRAPQKEDSFK